MNDKPDSQGEYLASIAEPTLDLFERVATAAEATIAAGGRISFGALVDSDPWHADAAINNLAAIGRAKTESAEVLRREPAIARIVVLNDAEEREIYFITRATPESTPGLASYRSPIGRLASLHIGDDYVLRTPKGVRNLEVIERAILRPIKDGGAWDSRNTVVERELSRSVTVVSLRALVAGEAIDPELLDKLLASEGRTANVEEGLRRAVITKMQLRDQPILDQFQDEIFRLTLDSRLVLLGPPGTGKTTTLIRRLGLKLDLEFLDESERDLVERVVNASLPHAKSWVMFTPTALLKQYVKEAFNKEGIAAPDERIQTWNDERLTLARQRLGVLRTGSGSGRYVMKRDLKSLQLSTQSRTRDWFNDFYSWQAAEFAARLEDSARALIASRERGAVQLGERLLIGARDARTGLGPAAAVYLAGMAREAQDFVTSKRALTEDVIRKALNLQVNRDRAFLDGLSVRLAELSAAPDPDDDLDDPDLEDEEIEESARIAAPSAREAAVAAYVRAVGAQARARARGRLPARNSQSAKIVEWLGDRTLSSDQMKNVGDNLLIQTAARNFINPLTRYLRGLPRRYRSYRRLRQQESVWYASEPINPNDVHPLEVDIILLGVLHAARTLMDDARVRRRLDEPFFTTLGPVRDLFRNQILVDEATDFSPVQIACMAALRDPVADSFFACGDFKQRTTTWGLRSRDDLSWVLPDLDWRTVTITYRHSRQLNEFARDLARASGDDEEAVALPDDVDSEGVSPVLAHGLKDVRELAAWITDRIKEIERLTRTLPSIAVFVNSETEVKPTAHALNEALQEINGNAVACVDGLVVGQESDVRVFDIQHIKGLEFEAVFFTGVDDLARDKPDIFDKYLYVGATRAATYLGLTCTGAGLPPMLKPLASRCVARW